jgi:dTDP-4-dehydrorhamnose reductase
MRVLVTGGAGQFARAIRATWIGDDLIMPDESMLDLTRRETIHAVCREHRPQVVINAGAFTQVDRCELEPERANLINGEAVGWLADACADLGALLVQISTDYVFDGCGTRPYREDDPTGPRSVYGLSKLRGEQEATRAPEHLILRTAWLYDAWGHNFMRTMLNAAAQGRKLRVVNDQFGGPTSCRALARQARRAVEGGWRGLVHATCAGETSWHDFAGEIFRQSKVKADLVPCCTDDYPLPAPRPAYSVLDGARRAQLGADLMPVWQEALAEVINSPEI